MDGVLCRGGAAGLITSRLRDERGSLHLPARKRAERDREPGTIGDGRDWSLRAQNRVGAAAGVRDNVDDVELAGRRSIIGRDAGCLQKCSRVGLAIENDRVTNRKAFSYARRLVQQMR